MLENQIMNPLPNIIDSFTNSAKAYDEKNQKLAPISENMHFLIRLILKNAPVRAHVLCVGIGTGAEILSLSKEFPEWTFVGIEPSIGMLEVCRERIKNEGLTNRCEFIQGYVDDAPVGENFDIALSILVGHFVKLQDKLNYYKAMTSRLRSNGILINSEISYDLESKEFPFMLKNWERIQSLMGATPESIANLSTVLRDMLSIISPAETEKILKLSGIPTPIQFFQSFMIHGWHGMKDS